MDALQAVEAAARDSYGRLVPYLSARSRDVVGAEDALGDTLQAALTSWPRDGVPAKPEAWLLAAARRKLMDEARRHEVRERNLPYVQQFMEAAHTADTPDGFPDERLKLLFICALPSIDAAARTPLMLQTVLGLDAARIASAFLVAPAAMSQRLVLRRASTMGVRVSRAAAVAEARTPDEGLAALDEIPSMAVASYQPYSAVRAHLLARLGRRGDALEAYTRAIGLGDDEAVRRFLQQSADRLR